MRGQSQVPRADRFLTHGKILYSEIDRLHWHAGWVRNVSISGLLFEGKYLAPIGASMEMTFVAPPAVFGVAEQDATEQVYCTGVIVRTEAGSEPGKLDVQMGTRITSWHRLPGGQRFR